LRPQKQKLRFGKIFVGMLENQTKRNGEIERNSYLSLGKKMILKEK